MILKGFIGGKNRNESWFIIYGTYLSVSAIQHTKILKNVTYLLCAFQYVLILLKFDFIRKHFLKTFYTYFIESEKISIAKVKTGHLTESKFALLQSHYASL